MYFVTVAVILPERPVPQKKKFSQVLRFLAAELSSTVGKPVTAHWAGV